MRSPFHRSLVVPLGVSLAALACSSPEHASSSGHGGGSVSSASSGTNGGSGAGAAPTGTGGTGSGPAGTGTAGTGGMAGSGSAAGGGGASGMPAGGVQVWLSDGDLGLHEAGVGHSLTLQTVVSHQYVSAANGGGGALTADRPQAQGWETFTLVDLNGGDVESGDLVYVRCSDGSWLSAANAGGAGLSAGATTPSTWETFVVERVAGPGAIQNADQIALRTRDGVHYVSATGGGGAGVVASATAVSGWESFVATLGAAETRWMERQADLAFSQGAPAGAIVVDDTMVGQTMVGFGSSFSQSSAWLLEEQLAAAPRAAALTAMFDPQQGIGLGAMRLPMGASDMMSDPSLVYTYDDVPSGQQDTALAHFSLAPDKADVMPLVEAARALAPDLFIVASPWSPPAWMKSTGMLFGGTLQDDDGIRSAYAQYFVRFLQGYAAAGVAIQAVTPQNEPLYQPTGYPGSGSDPVSEAKLVGGFLGPAIAAAGLGTRILTYDHNWDDTSYPLSVLGDATAGPFVAGAAFHCYGGQPSAQDAIQAAYPGKDVWMTECSDGDWVPNPFGSKMWLLAESTRHWAKGVILWNLAMTLPGGPALPGGCTSCRGIVAVDPATGTWLPTVQYYALGHFSRFVRPGAVRIGSDGGPSGLEQVAFRNTDGTHVLVVSNQGTAAAAFSVVTGVQTFSYQLAGGGAVTLRW
jgi:glucosylceramidase